MKKMKKLLFLFALVAFLGTTVSANVVLLTNSTDITIVDNDKDKDKPCCKHKTKAECKKDSENCCKDENCECQAKCDTEAKKDCDKKDAKKCCDKDSKKGSSCVGNPRHSCNHGAKLPKK